MKEHSLGISISLLFHLIVVALLLRVPLDQFIKSKSIVIDFTLEKGQTIAGRHGVAKNREQKTDELKTGKRQNNATAENTQQITKADFNKEMQAATDYTAGREDAVDRTHSDQAGQIVPQDGKIRQEAKNSAADEKHFFAGQGIHHGLSSAPGNGKLIDYNKGDTYEKDFPFITDVVQKQFKDKYPDRARRMGWEGKVLLAFVIMENGTVHDVEVMNSSGRRDFDDHAREILEKTKFNRQLPYRIQVKNWLVTYRLQ
jgi:TonB family protein